MTSYPSIAGLGGKPVVFQHDLPDGTSFSFSTGDGYEMSEDYRNEDNVPVVVDYWPDGTPLQVKIS